MPLLLMHTDYTLTTLSHMRYYITLRLLPISVIHCEFVAEVHEGVAGGAVGLGQDETYVGGAAELVYLNDVV